MARVRLPALLPAGAGEARATKRAAHAARCRRTGRRRASKHLLIAQDRSALPRRRRGTAAAPLVPPGAAAAPPGTATSPRGPAATPALPLSLWLPGLLPLRGDILDLCFGPAMVPQEPDQATLEQAHVLGSPDVLQLAGRGVLVAEEGFLETNRDLRARRLCWGAPRFTTHAPSRPFAPAGSEACRDERGGMVNTW